MAIKYNNIKKLLISSREKVSSYPSEQIEYNITITYYETLYEEGGLGNILMQYDG